jgi:tetratricopeptide (TPR) repeat protein
MITLGAYYGVNFQFDAQGRLTGIGVGRHKKTLGVSELLSVALSPPSPSSPLFISEFDPRHEEMRRLGLDPNSGRRIVQPLSEGDRTLEVFQGAWQMADVGAGDRVAARLTMTFNLRKAATWTLVFPEAEARPVLSGVEGTIERGVAIDLQNRTTLYVTSSLPIGVEAKAGFGRPGELTLKYELPRGSSSIDLQVESRPLYDVADTVIVCLPTQMREAAVVVAGCQPENRRLVPLIDLPLPPHEPATLEAAQSKVQELDQQLRTLEEEIAKQAQAAQAPSVAVPGSPTDEQKTAQLVELLAQREQLIAQMAEAQEPLLDHAAWQRRWERGARLIAGFAPSKIALLCPYPSSLIDSLPIDSLKLFFLREEWRPQLGEWEKALRNFALLFYRDLEDLARVAWKALSDRPLTGAFEIPNDDCFYPLGVRQALKVGKPLVPKGRAGEKTTLEAAMDLVNKGIENTEAVIAEGDGSIGSLLAALYADWIDAPLYVTPAPQLDAVYRKLDEIEKNIENESKSQMMSAAYRYISEHRDRFMSENVDPQLKSIAMSVPVIALPGAPTSKYSPQVFVQVLIDYLNLMKQGVTTAFRYLDPQRNADLAALEELVTAQVSPYVRGKAGAAASLTAFTRGLPYTFVAGWDKKPIGHVTAEPAMLLLREVAAGAFARPPLSFAAVFDPGFFLVSESPKIEQRLQTTLVQSLYLRDEDANRQNLSVYPQVLPVEGIFLDTHGGWDGVVLRRGREDEYVRDREIELGCELAYSPIIINNSCMSWRGVGAACLAAGARGYVGTLWTVKNPAAAEIALQTLERMLAGGVPVSQALAGVQVDDLLTRRAYLYVGLARGKFEAWQIPPEQETEVRKAALNLVHRPMVWLADNGLLAQAQTLYEKWQQMGTAYLPLAEEETAKADLLLDEATYFATIASKTDVNTARQVLQKSQQALDELAGLRIPDSEKEKRQAWAWQRMGYVEIGLGEWQQAMKHYKACLDFYQSTGDQNRQAVVLHQLGILYQHQGEWGKALEQYEKSLAIKEVLGDRQGVAQSLHQIGTVYQYQGEWVKALEQYEKARQEFEALGDRQGVARSLHNVGTVCQLQGEWGKALEHYEKGLAIEKALGDRQGVAASLGQIGMMYQDQGEWGKALERYERACQEFKALGDRHGMAHSLYQIGTVYRLQGEWEKALEQHEKARQEFKALGDRHGMAMSLHNIGLVYQDLGEWGQALEQYEQACQEFEALGDRQNAAKSLHQIGTVYHFQGEWGKALEHYEKSLTVSEALGDRQNAATSLHQIGMVHRGQGEWGKALKQYEKARQEFEALGDRQGVAKSLHEIGTVYHFQGEWAKALQHFQAAAQTFAEIGDRPNQVVALRDIAFTLIELGRFAEALQQMSNALRLSLSLHPKVFAETFGRSIVACRRVAEKQASAEAVDGARALSRVIAESGLDEESKALFGKAYRVVEQWLASADEKRISGLTDEEILAMAREVDEKVPGLGLAEWCQRSQRIGNG